MKPKAALHKLAGLLKKSSFTSQDAKTVGVTSATLSYYVKSGELVRIGRGLYKGVHSPEIKDFRWEDILIVSTQIPNGVVCLLSALAFYDLTEEIPRQHWIAIPNNTRHRNVKLVRIVRMRNIDLGKTRVDIDGHSMPIFDRERTLIDTFRYLSIETAIKSLKNALALKGSKKIDLEKLLKYAKILRFKIEPYIIGLAT